MPETSSRVSSIITSFKSAMLVEEANVASNPQSSIVDTKLSTETLESCVIFARFVRRETLASMTPFSCSSASVILEEHAPQVIPMISILVATGPEPCVETDISRASKPQSSMIVISVSGSNSLEKVTFASFVMSETPAFFTLGFASTASVMDPEQAAQVMPRTEIRASRIPSEGFVNENEVLNRKKCKRAWL
ncbi:hypothetical protein METSCH_B07910 [Metschnikowia aff. pulcherrima]|uniref:Uncharacterized protein n=1 Tax=Metschnikowia aff. pulcherrima TaxID=2163413 RepID=A0A4P6XPF8_9ASCO|nr:hypothetical protein METSCH_B07910 [Metschnikowia aff. pulcherrima]